MIVPVAPLVAPDSVALIDEVPIAMPVLSVLGADTVEVQFLQLVEQIIRQPPRFGEPGTPA